MPNINDASIDELWYAVRNLNDEAVLKMADLWRSLGERLSSSRTTLKTGSDEVAKTWLGTAADAYLENVEKTKSSLEAASIAAYSNGNRLELIGLKMGTVQRELRPLWDEYQQKMKDMAREARERERSHKGSSYSLIDTYIAAPIRRASDALFADTPNPQAERDKFSERARVIVRPLVSMVQETVLVKPPEFTGPKAVNATDLLTLRLEMLQNQQLSMAAPGAPGAPGAVAAPPPPVAPALGTLPRPPASPAASVPPVPKQPTASGIRPPAPPLPRAPQPSTSPPRPGLGLPGSRPPAPQPGQMPPARPSGLTPPVRSGGPAPVAGRPPVRPGLAGNRPVGLGSPNAPSPARGAIPAGLHLDGPGTRAGVPGVPPGTGGASRRSRDKRPPVLGTGRPEGPLSEELGTLTPPPMSPNLAGRRAAPTRREPLASGPIPPIGAPQPPGRTGPRSPATPVAPSDRSDNPWLPVEARRPDLTGQAGRGRGPTGLGPTLVGARTPGRPGSGDHTQQAAGQRAEQHDRDHRTIEPTDDHPWEIPTAAGGVVDTPVAPAVPPTGEPALPGNTAVTSR
ncbi:hypothetical protein ACWDV4_01460 [Micromonospora sp. NPDC003197]